MGEKLIEVDNISFACSNPIEITRAKTLLTKEEGTIAWLNNLKQGERFLDIGANVGCYTLYACKKVGITGKVYAIEPHVASASKLLVNVFVNQFTGIVDVLSVALSSKEGFLPFFYRSRFSGSSGSQIGVPVGEDGDFTAELREVKYTTSVDALIAKGVIAMPHMVKIDVDGNEPNIIYGMDKTLHSNLLRSVQIEMRYSYEPQIVDFMKAHAFNLVYRHYTTLGKQAMVVGKSLETIVHNAVFER